MDLKRIGAVFGNRFDAGADDLQAEAAGDRSADHALPVYAVVPRDGAGMEGKHALAVVLPHNQSIARGASGSCAAVYVCAAEVAGTHSVIQCVDGMTTPTVCRRSGQR